MEQYRLPDEQLKIYEGLQTPFAVYRYADKRVVTLALSRGFLDLFGFEDRAEAYDRMDHDMYRDTHPDDIARIENAAIRFAEGYGDYDVIYRSAGKDGAYMVIHAQGKHTVTGDGVRVAHVWYTNEGPYSAESEGDSRLNTLLSNALHEQSILSTVRYDMLTGLPSMTFFFEFAEKERDAALKDQRVPTLLYFDICGLKYYNYKHGFAAGDDLLRSFSRIIGRLFGNDFCCHIGQDHFAAFTVDDDVEKRLSTLFADLKELNFGAALPVRVGIYRDPNCGTVPVSTACDRAKLACDTLKGAYASAYSYYRPEIKDNVIKKQYILDSFERALENRWIVVYYQPIVRTVSGRVCDEEALSRWIDPEVGFLSPADFIPALEESGQIYKLDLYVLDRVLEKIKLQSEKELTVVPHSINLSRSDFDACDIVDEITRRVDASGVGRDKITIEITESIIGKDFDFMKEQIVRFRNSGFAVWMDDFGSGYSSLDVLQSIRFDLVKFDMSFMRHLDDGDGKRDVLTELMRLANSLDLDTICEGVETEKQLRFLREIGCSKLQGYYFCKPIPLEQIIERYAQNRQIGFENPDETSYYTVIGAINLYDLTVLAGGEESDAGDPFARFFNTLPMGVVEIRGNKARFLRSNRSYRVFVRQFLHFDLSREGAEFKEFDNGFMNNVVTVCCKRGQRSFYDENMPDGSVVHSFARKIAYNPVTDTYAVAIAVLSITQADEGTTYADIARALASDYYNIYYVDLDTEEFIEYTSPVGAEELAMERHGENFFAACLEVSDRIYEEDRAPFFAAFTKENVIRELDEQGVFTATYRLMDTGEPMYVNMKITRLRPGSSKIILGVSIIDAQMKHNAHDEDVRQERDALAKVMALTEGYLSLYTVDPETGHYVEYSATSDYESLGFAKEGEDFFTQGVVDGKRVVHPDDLPAYLARFRKEIILHDIKEHGSFGIHYRLIIGGEPKQVSLRIAAIPEKDKVSLVAGVRAWKHRK